MGCDTAVDDASLNSLKAREKEGKRRKQPAKIGKFSVQLQTAQGTGETADIVFLECC